MLRVGHMKVRDLQEALAKLDADSDIVLYKDDDGELFDIVDVTPSTVKRSRDAGGKPRMLFESESRDRVVVVTITKDF